MPKCLLQINGKELICYSIELFDPLFIDKLIISPGAYENQIKDWLGSLRLPYKNEFRNPR